MPPDPTTGRAGTCGECGRVNVRLTLGGKLDTHTPTPTDVKADPHSPSPGDGTDPPLCPGVGDYPNRAEPGAHSATSQFASCPAATGAAWFPKGCAQFPDGAHRCGQARGGHHTHQCTCRYTWSIAATG